MANTTLTAKVLQVAHTTAEWTQITDVISKGLLCVEFTTDAKTKLKVGDGVNTYDKLPFTGAEIDLTMYSTTEEMNKAIADAVTALGSIVTVKGIVGSVDELPTEKVKVGDMYFVGTQGESDNSFSEYVYTANKKWEYVGEVHNADLDKYATKDYVTNAIKDLVTNSHTHTNKSVLDGTTASFTTELKEKLDGIEAEANKYELPTAAKDVLGGVKTSSAVDDISGYTPVPIVNGIPYYKNTVTTVDSELSASSTNPVQNKVIKEQLDDTVKKSDTLVINCTL